MKTYTSKERNHVRAVESYRKGEGHRWVACLAASRIVGDYTEGATSALANDLSLSIRYVDNLADAGRMYRSLRRFVPGHEMHHIRARTTVKHWYRMAETADKYDLDPHEIIEQLRTAADEGASVEAMIASIDGDNEPIDMWEKRWERMVKSADMIYADMDAPEYIRRTCCRVLELCNAELVETNMTFDVK